MDTRGNHPIVRAVTLAVLFGGLMASAHGAQVVVYQETFETDGEGVRWSSIGRGVSEDPASGPAFWGLNFGPDAPSFVGVRAIAPARRAAIVWRHDLPTDSVTEDALKLVDGVAAWLATGRPSTTVLFSPPRAGSGDELIIARLTAAGFTVVDDDTASPLPDPATIAFAISSSSGSVDPVRFTAYTAPMLSYNAPNHDDELISSIGATVSTDLGPVTVTTPAHPAANGLTGGVSVLVSPQNVDTIGANIPAGATTVATYDLASPRLALTLADVDEMVAGSFASSHAEGTIAGADLAAGESGRWNFGSDNPVPGNPDNTGTYGVRATGRIIVDQAGTYTFAFGVDDAARLRIDIDKNGLDAGDTVFSEEDGSGFRVLSQNVTFAEAGTYDIEWVTLCTGANFGQEISVNADDAEVGQPVDPWDLFAWNLLDNVEGKHIRLESELSVTSYVPTDVSIEKRAFLLVIDGGAALLGGPLRDQQGDGFWGGADLNDVDFGTPSDDNVGRFLTLQSVDVRGMEDLQLVLALAGSDVDFEANDFLKISVDPDGSGPEPFQILAEYRGIGGGPMGDTLGSGTPANYILRGNFRDVQYNLPAGASDLVIQFEANSTFFNEVVGIDNIRVLAKGPDAPELSIVRNGANVEVRYTGTLLSSQSVDGEYTPVANAQNPHVITPGTAEAQRFYRSINP